MQNLEQELLELKRQVAVSDYAKRAVAFGMNEFMADEFAAALYGADDADAVFRAMYKFKTDFEKELKAKHTRPPHDGCVPDVSKAEFSAMSYPQRIDLYNRQPELYSRLTGGH